MRFYVVIPAHNEEAFIKDCLVSLMEQSLPPKKIIVVDDNSNDQTGGIQPIFPRISTTLQTNP